MYIYFYLFICERTESSMDHVFPLRSSSDVAALSRHQPESPWGEPKLHMFSMHRSPCCKRPLQAGAGDARRSTAATATDGADGFLKARAQHVKQLALFVANPTFSDFQNLSPLPGTQKRRRLPAGLSGPRVIPKRKKKARLRKRREKTCSDNILLESCVLIESRYSFVCNSTFF